MGDSGGAGFKGSPQEHPFAAQVAARGCRQSGSECGIKNLEVRIKGPARVANLRFVPSMRWA